MSSGNRCGATQMTENGDMRPSRLSELRAGWSALLACLIGQAVGVHTLVPYTTGFFIAPLEQSLGWSRTSISLGVTFATLATAAGAPIAGMVVNVVGERVLIAFSMVVVSACYLLLATIGVKLTAYWMLLSAMAFLGVGCSPVTLSRIMVARFYRARGAALGITLLGPGLTGLLAALLLSKVIDTAGWRGGFAALGATVLAALPIVLGLLLLVIVIFRPTGLIGFFVSDRERVGSFGRPTKATRAPEAGHEPA